MKSPPFESILHFYVNNVLHKYALFEFGEFADFAYSFVSDVVII
jgi:hypothetical protein